MIDDAFQPLSARSWNRSKELPIIFIERKGSGIFHIFIEFEHADVVCCLIFDFKTAPNE